MFLTHLHWCGSVSGSLPSMFSLHKNFETQEKLPPTDSRLRPDQRCLENGQYEMANSEKLRLEQRQRQVIRFTQKRLPFTFHFYFCLYSCEPASALWSYIPFMIKAVDTNTQYCHCNAGQQDAGERLEAEMVCEGERWECIPLCWRLLGDQGSWEVGIMSWYLWPSSQGSYFGLIKCWRAPPFFYYYHY